MHLHPQQTSQQADGLYYGGWVFGSYSGCGWVAGDLDATSTLGSELCPSGSIGYNLNEFASATNANAVYYGNDCNPKPDGSACTDGSTTSLKQTCTYWANFRPWASNQSLKDLIHGALPAGTIVKWRYIAKYRSSSGHWYAMIKLANAYGVPRGWGNWGFVNVSCLAGLPYYTPVS